MLDNKFHTITLSEDGSYTAYSKEYDEHYHSTKDGALHESFSKHVLPAFKVKNDLEELNILDICYGLGFNTLSTILYHKHNNLKTKLNIYSPELDAKLVESLHNFPYPHEFSAFKKIIESISATGKYKDDTLNIEVFLGDAREYVRKFEKKFDIVYQDAFSPSNNPALWTQEFFKDIKKSMKPDAILTTYSISLPTRLALHNNDFFIYINAGDGYRKATVASLSTLEGLKKVDMEHKIKCNPNVKPFYD